MHEVLVIAHRFPPLGGSSVQRTLGFVRHLPANGWRPTVICTNDDDETPGVRDPSLLYRVPLEATIVRVPSGVGTMVARQVRGLLPTRFRSAFDQLAFVPDRQAPWTLSAVRAALRIAEAGRFSALYSAGDPWTNHLVAALVQAQTRLPWVADIVDPSTQDTAPPRTTPVHRALHRRLRTTVLRRSSRIVAATPGHQRSMQAELYSEPNKVRLIPDGYAVSDFTKSRPAVRERRPLLLGLAEPPHFGTEPLLELLARVRGEAPPFRLRFMGPGRLTEGAARAGLRDLTDELDYRSHADLLDQLAECHATVVTVPGRPRPSGSVPQKLYVYLRLGRPLLGVLPPGDAAELIRQAGEQHLLQDPAALDPARAVAWLHRLADDRIAPTSPETFVVQRHARDVLTLRLAGVLNELAEDPLRISPRRVEDRIDRFAGPGRRTQ